MRSTPAEDVYVQVDTLGSDYDTVMAIYTRDEAGRIVEGSCNDDRLGSASGLRLRAAAGTTYLFMVGRCCGNGSSDRPGGRGGQLVVTVTEVSSVPLDFVVTVDGGTVDPATGIATISGTITCTKRSLVYGDAELRQLRDGIFIARGGWYWYGTWMPDAPMTLSVEGGLVHLRCFRGGFGQDEDLVIQRLGRLAELLNRDETAAILPCDRVGSPGAPGFPTLLVILPATKDARAAKGSGL